MDCYVCGGGNWYSAACAYHKRTQIGYQPFVHLTSGRKIVINRLCTPQADVNWLSAACEYHKRTQIGYQPFVHLTSGRKLVINRLCTPQAGDHNPAKQKSTGTCSNFERFQCFLI